MVQAVQLKESAMPINSWHDHAVPPSIASFVQQCYPHKNQGHTKKIALNKTNGQVIYGSCTCIAGSSACNHTAALMFAVDDMNRTHASQGSSRGPSSTSLPRKWGVPAKPRKDPTPVNMLEVVKPKYGKVP